MPTRFEFSGFGIGDLLKRGRLQVPPNQRSYAWEEIHVRNLLEDLNEAISNETDDYFLGTVVLVSDGALGNGPADQSDSPSAQTGRVDHIQARAFRSHRYVQTSLRGIGQSSGGGAPPCSRAIPASPQGTRVRL